MKFIDKYFYNLDLDKTILGLILGFLIAGFVWNSIRISNLKAENISLKMKIEKIEAICTICNNADTMNAEYTYLLDF